MYCLHCGLLLPREQHRAQPVWGGHVRVCYWAFCLYWLRGGDVRDGDGLHAGWCLFGLWRGHVPDWHWLLSLHYLRSGHVPDWDWLLSLLGLRGCHIRDRDGLHAGWLLSPLCCRDVPDRDRHLFLLRLYRWTEQPSWCLHVCLLRRGHDAQRDSHCEVHVLWRVPAVGRACGGVQPGCQDVGRGRGGSSLWIWI